MIETEQSIAISAAIEEIWGYVRDIQRWANLMPGCKSCTLLGPDDSRWLLKVGVGGLVRTVNVLVHVEQWDGPRLVRFSYQLEGDPVVGGGAYSAVATSERETEVAFKVRVEGSGSMAPMWEALCRPLLPQLAKSFAKRLKEEIETSAGA
jgi:carbon monoxide dehydrogenase subunit G